MDPGKNSEMSKRPPDSSVEALVLSGMDSPRSKRVKIDEVVDQEFAHRHHGNDAESPAKRMDDDDEEDEEDSRVARRANAEGPPAGFSDLYLDTGKSFSLSSSDCPPSIRAPCLWNFT